MKLAEKYKTLLKNNGINTQKRLLMTPEQVTAVQTKLGITP